MAGKLIPRKITIENDIGYVPLTQGMVAMIDAEDVERVGRYNWFYKKNHGRPGYASANISGGKQVTLSRFIMEPEPDVQIDHMSGDTLDNRRSNLRPASHGQNSCNSRRRRDAKQRFRGVTEELIQKTPRPFRGFITTLGRRIYSKPFATDVEAARWYNDMASKHHGEFARLNEIPPT